MQFNIVNVNTGLDPGGVIFYTNIYKGCRMNPKVAHFTGAFYSDRGGYATVENVCNFNIYANIGPAPQPGCFSSSTDIHSNSIEIF